MSLIRKKVIGCSYNELTRGRQLPPALLSLVLASLSALLAVGYFTASKWAIRHETVTFKDPSRDNRPVEVDIAVRRDKEMQANAGMIKLPVAVINHGNTVKFTEYSFISNVFAMRGISRSAYSMICRPIRQW